MFVGEWGATPPANQNRSIMNYVAASEGRSGWWVDFETDNQHLVNKMSQICLKHSVFIEISQKRLEFNGSSIKQFSSIYPTCNWTDFSAEEHTRCFFWLWCYKSMKSDLTEDRIQSLYIKYSAAVCVVFISVGIQHYCLLSYDLSALSLSPSRGLTCFPGLPCLPLLPLSLHADGGRSGK